MGELVISSIYAESLFAVAKELGKREAFLKELKEIKALLENDPLFLEFFLTPRLSKFEKKEVFRNVFEGEITQEVLNFMYVIIDKHRMSFFFQIVKTYIKLENIEDSLYKGTITSSMPLSEASIREFEEKISNLINKKAVLENVIDPSILGGVKIFIDDKIIDASVSNKLNEMAHQLKNKFI